ncbi:MAG: type II toxin-antitoxin system RelE/ParE family toxin [Methanothrix sp.]
MTFSYTTTRQFDKRFHKLTRKNQALKDQVFEKTSEILDNPEIGVPKKHELKGLCGAHVDPFVIIYTIIGDRIVFLHFDHHDQVYNAATIFSPSQMEELRKRFEGFEPP